MTVSHDRLDGLINMSSPVGGFLGGPYDSYMTFSIGINAYLSRGDKADLPDFYTGLKDQKDKDIDPKRMIRENDPKVRTR
ncbi:hypothetical protein MASR1M107_18050 [Ignavibacteriales bacterium]